MCMKYQDITDQKFGRLTAIKPIGAIGSDRSMWWFCECDCGNKINVPAKHLKSGNTSSCGCLAVEKHCCVSVHGVRYHPLYDVWWLIKDRCENPNRSGYENYGGRGIRMCDEWHDVVTFISWAENNGYQEGLEIDRIDVNGDYEPSNCRFVTHKQNANNRRNNHLLTYNGRTQTLTQWSEELQISKNIISSRLKKGWSIEEVLTLPKYQHKKG